MNCPSCSKAVSGVYEAGSYSCSGCGAEVQVNPARHKHVAFGTEGANKRWGKSKATGTKKKTKKNPSFEYPPHSSPEFPGEGAGYARSQSGAPSYSAGQSATRNPDSPGWKQAGPNTWTQWSPTEPIPGIIDPETGQPGFGVRKWGRDWLLIDLSTDAQIDMPQKTKRALIERAHERAEGFFGPNWRGNPSSNPKRMTYAVFVPASRAGSGAMRWAMQSEGFQPERTGASSAWWTRVTTKKEALRLGEKFEGLVTEMPATWGGTYDGPTFRSTSRVLKDFRLGHEMRREPGSDPITGVMPSWNWNPSNPPFAEHELEAKEKHWALEDNPATTQYSIRIKQQGSGAWAGIRYYDTKVKAEMEFARLDAPRERTGTKGERYMMAIFHGNKKIKQNFYD